MAEAPYDRSESQQGRNSERQNDMSMGTETDEEDSGHEVEVLPGLDHQEEESQQSWEKCKKNPGHKNFISASKFGIEDLPKRAQRQENENYVKGFIDLTVRLKVSYTSDERPDEYANAHLRGEYKPRYGTGWVTDYERGEGLCPCSTCKVIRPSGQEWYRIEVRTARHVIYSEDEVEFTEVNFFYDDKESMTDGRVKTVFGTNGYCWMNGDVDDCFFFCVFHDGDLAERLREIFERSDLPPEIEIGEAVAVIVSHPHGRPKHITVGDVGIHGFSFMVTKNLFFYYTNDTCGGSSGAPVLVLGTPNVGRTRNIFFYPLPHRQTLNQRLNLSICKRAASYDEDERSCHEIEESVDTWKVCAKNYGHKTFIPASKFGLKDYLSKVTDQENEVKKQETINCIKAYSNLTVRLRVNHTSQERPNGYPFSDRASDSTRYGSGWVEDVSPIDHYRYEIWVRTSRLLVYNEAEATQTIVDFFYDDEESQAKGRMKTVSGSDHTVDGRRYQWIHGDSDDCFFICITQDKDLIRQLKQALETLNYQRMENQVIAKDPRQDLVVVISHPHGMAKYITLGSTTGTEYSDIESHGHTYFEYTADTCPGSTGALVLVVTPFPRPLTHSHSKLVKLNRSTGIIIADRSTHLYKSSSPETTRTSHEPNARNSGRGPDLTQSQPYTSQEQHGTERGAQASLGQDSVIDATGTSEGQEDSATGGQPGPRQPQLDSSQENPLSKRLKEIVDEAKLSILMLNQHKQFIPSWLLYYGVYLQFKNEEWRIAFLSEFANALSYVASTQPANNTPASRDPNQNLLDERPMPTPATLAESPTTTTDPPPTCVGTQSTNLDLSRFIGAPRVTTTQVPSVTGKCDIVYGTDSLRERMYKIFSWHQRPETFMAFKTTVESKIHKSFGVWLLRHLVCYVLFNFVVVPSRS